MNNRPNLQAIIDTARRVGQSIPSWMREKKQPPRPVAQSDAKGLDGLRGVLK
jgi:hypothetical protein